MIKLVRIVRNVEFSQLFDDFFISAITTILVIRFYLKITGYPQIATSDLHISHLVPGSLLMLAAIIILLAAVNRAARNFAAVVGGVGFGLVLDEIGKFVTKDYNYFFHATPGLIYLTFIVLYLIVRYSAGRRLTQDDYMANVLDLIKDAAIKDLDQREYEHAKELLSHVSPRHVLYGPTKQMLENVRPKAVSQPSLLERLLDQLDRPLRALSRQAFFSTLIISIAVVYGFISIAAAAFFFAGATIDDVKTLPAFLHGDSSDVIAGLSAAAAALSSVIATAFYKRGAHQRAYRYFEVSLLVNIFIGQVVLFFKNQDIALAWLAVTLFLLINLKSLNAQEARRVRKI